MKNESDVFSGVVVLEGLREGSEYAANLRLKYRGGFSGWSSPLPFSTKASGRDSMTASVLQKAVIKFPTENHLSVLSYMYNYCHLFSLLVLPTWLIVIIVIVAIAVTVVVLAAGVYSRRFVLASHRLVASLYSFLSVPTEERPLANS